MYCNALLPFIIDARIYDQAVGRLNRHRTTQIHVIKDKRLKKTKQNNISVEDDFGVTAALLKQFTI